MGNFRRLLKLIRIAFTPLSLIIIGVLIWSSRSTLSGLLEQTQWYFIVAVIILWVCSNAIASAVSVFLLRSLGTDLDYQYILRIHCQRLPGKYLPGGIWHSVGRANDYLEKKVEPKKVALFFIAENYTLVAVTLMLSAGLVAEYLANYPFGELATYIQPAMILALLAFPLTVQLLTKGKYTLKTGSFLTAIVLLALYWLLIGATFALYLSAFSNIELISTPTETAAVYIFSWCLGYLTIFAPQGIGVAEYISSSLLTGESGNGAILAVLLGFRLLILIADLISWALNHMLNLLPQENSQPSHSD